MSKSSCISHAPHQQLVMIRQDYLLIADNNHCAAALLNIFEYWHNTKLANQEQAQIENEIAQAGDAPPVSDELWVYKTIPDFQEELLGLFGANKIGDALKLLTNKGYVTTRNNPKYGWDRTLQYLFNVEDIQAALLSLPSFKNKASTRLKNKASKRAKSKDASFKNKPAIPQITSEITSEITTETTPTTPARGRESQSETDVVVEISDPIPEKVYAPIQTDPNLPCIPDFSDDQMRDLIAQKGHRWVSDVAAHINANLKTIHTPGGFLVKEMQYNRLGYRDKPRQTPPSVPLVSPSDESPAEDDPDSLAHKLRNGSRATAPEPPPHESLLAALPGSNVTPHDAWVGAFNQLEITLDHDNFERGLRDAKLIQLDGGVFVIGARSQPARDHCERTLYRNIRAKLSDAAGKPVELRFEVARDWEVVG